jgi:cytochrome c peroxidase
MKCNFQKLLIIFIVLPVTYSCTNTVKQNVKPKPPTLKLGIADEIRQYENFDAIATLGEKVFNDTNLSIPAGVSCASCHDAGTGFAEPDNQLPTSQGSLGKTTFGKRNAPTAAYAAYIPEPQKAVIKKNLGITYIGGQFWDGRASNLVEQAKMPFLDPLEMNHPNAASVIDTIQKTPYANEFKQLFGNNVFADKELAFTQVAITIAAFEMTPVFSPFNAKYDAVKRGEEVFTKQEARGEKLFHDGAQCARCHFTPEHFGPQVFSTFQYFNIGTPTNKDSPFQQQQPKFRDYGLAQISEKHGDKGLFRIPTLRNVDKTAPYLHNGVFTTLEEVVEFYSRGDIAPEYAPTVADDGFYNTGINLKKEQIADIVAFLKTLSDR